MKLPFINYFDKNLKYEKPSSLQKRMKTLVKTYNGNKCHYYRPHIVSLRSKQILAYLNKVTELTDKVMMLKTFQKIFTNVCKKLLDKYDPHVIYTFSNEIHVVFYYNDYGNFLYDGNVNKILTSLVSYASILVASELTKLDINLDFCFEGTFVEIKQDYEALNYLIARQFACKVNTINLLYKCLDDVDNCIDFLKIDNMENKINEKMPIDYTFVLGITLKKKLYNKKTNPNEYKKIENEGDFDEYTEYIRKRIEINCIWFSDNFMENMEEYISNKFL